MHCHEPVLDGIDSSEVNEIGIGEGESEENFLTNEESDIVVCLNEYLFRN